MRYFVVVSPEISESCLISVECGHIETGLFGLEAILDHESRKRVITIQNGCWFAYGPYDAIIAEYINMQPDISGLRGV